VQFTIRIPCSLYSLRQKYRGLIQYGHGLFGTRNEISDSYNDNLAEKNGYIIFATDWQGMSRYDLLSTLKSFVMRGSDLRMLPERLMQGYINKLVHFKLMKGLGGETYMKNEKGGAIYNDKTPAFFYGISQGAIVGGGIAS
jgi:hypothetical protein